MVVSNLASSSRSTQARTGSHAAAWRPATHYPDAAIHALDPRFEKYWLKLSAVERLTTGLRWAEGPVWVGDGRYFRKEQRLAVFEVSGDRYDLVESLRQRPSRSFSLHHQRLPYSVVRISIIVLVGIETEQGPGLAHMKRQGSGDVEGPATRMGKDNPPRVQVKFFRYGLR